MLVTGALTLAGPPAVAHDALLSSDPADGAVVTEPPVMVVLTFAAAQAEIGTEVVVTGSDGASWSDGAAMVSGTTVTQPLKAGMPSDGYTVQWRSVAADGHPVSGTLTFTVDLPAEARPTETPVTVETPATVESPVAVTPTAAGEPAANGGTALPWLLGGAGVAAAGAVAVVVARRRDRDE